MPNVEKADPLGRTMLVIGGTRSGKSAFAEQLCEQSKLDLLYVATSPLFPDDKEMQTRIKHHVERRGQRWQLIEQELELAQTIKNNMCPGRAILIDCLTLWLNNLLYHDRNVSEAIKGLTSVLDQRSGTILFITNEVGQGIVPVDKATRAFRDEQGRLNQAMAGACDQVVSVTAGIPVLLKPGNQPPISL